MKFIIVPGDRIVPDVGSNTLVGRVIANNVVMKKRLPGEFCMNFTRFKCCPALEPSNYP